MQEHARRFHRSHSLPPLDQGEHAVNPASSRYRCHKPYTMIHVLSFTVHEKGNLGISPTAIADHRHHWGSLTTIETDEIALV